MTDDRPDWARRLQAERRARGWSHRTTAEAMIAHGARAGVDSLTRSLKRWEQGAGIGRHNQQVIAHTFGVATAVIFPPRPVLERGCADASHLEILARIRTTDLDTATFDGLEAAVDKLSCDYSHAPSEILHANGRLWLERLTGLLDRRLTLAQHRDILSLAGRVALLVGCVEYDLGQRERAEATRQAALSLGEESGDANVVGWAWEMDAWYALTQGRYANTVKAADAGLAAVDSSHSVGVQLAAHKAKAWARIGDRREVEVALDRGRALLEALPDGQNVASHFVVDPSKWDFYVMDAYRQVGDDDLAAMYADEVIRTGTDDDGTVTRPMRVAEARITRGVVAARAGDLEGALLEGRTALGMSRKSLPSLLLHGRELAGVMLERFPGEPQAVEFEDELRALAA